MAKNEISWKSITPEGKRQVYAEKNGIHWHFHVRQQRYERWERLEQPPLQEWLQLLDGVQRRIARRLLRPEEEKRLKRTILERFPEADL